MTSQISAIYDQPDVATLTHRGVVYRCTVYIVAKSPLPIIEATCKIEQENGDSVTVFTNTVWIPLEGDRLVDSPKIIASGDQFIVHWLEYGAPLILTGPVQNAVIRRATMNMASFSSTTWVSQGTSSLHPDLLYDVSPVIGSASGDYVVTRKAVAADTVSTSRYSGLGWLDIEWITNLTIEMTGVLGVIAYERAVNDGCVVITYEGNDRDVTDYRLYSSHMDVGDGVSAAGPVLTFDAFPLARFYNVGHCLTGINNDRVTVVAEAGLSSVAFDTPDRYCHYLAYREINGSNVSLVGNEHWVPNLCMVSSPWSWRSGTSIMGENGTEDVYVLASYNNAGLLDGWAQSRVFVLNLQKRNWNLAVDGPLLRPQIVATASSVGIADGRLSVWSPAWDQQSWGLMIPQKRRNHLPSPCPPRPSGPDRKAYAIPCVLWARFVAVRTLDASLGAGVFRSELKPEGSAIVHYKFYMEDPWTAPREAGVPEPSENFLAPYPRAMHQSVEAGRSLVIAGGCPSSYDGVQTVELGYPWAPEVLRHLFLPLPPGSLVPVEAGLDAGVYQMYAVYVWTDAQNQVHRSGPSRVYTFTVSEANAGLAVVYRVRSMTMSLKGPSVFYPSGQPITVEVYRTTVFNMVSALTNVPSPGQLPIGGSFYRVYGANLEGSFFNSINATVNDPTSIWTDVYDGVQDALLIYQGLGPYQFSLSYGITPMPPQTVPAMSVIARYRNRVLMTTGEDNATIWYSKEVRPDFGSDFYQAPEFSDTNTFRVDGIDEITAMVGMGDILVVFTRAGIFTISGEFNNDLGQGASLNISPRHEGTGCIEPRSIVLAPPGVFFQSHKGYYLLDLSFQLDFVSAGASVEDFLRDAGNISDATLLEDRHQVRLTCNGRPGFTRTVEHEFFALNANGGSTITFTFEVLGTDVDVVLIYVRPPNISTASARQQIQALIVGQTGVGEPLHGVIASVSNGAGTNIIVTWVENVTTLGFSFNATADSVISLLTDTVAHTSARPTVLIYDYFHRMWSEAVMPMASVIPRRNRLVSGCAWRGYASDIAHVALHEGGLHVERSLFGPLTFTDSNQGGNVGIPIDIRTAWLHLAGYAGMHRVWEVGVQSERRYAGAMFVDIEYDDDGSYEGLSPAGETFTWQNPAPAYMPFRLSRQQISGLTVRIYEPPGSNTNDTIAIVGLVFELGAQKGPRRTSDAQRGT